MSGGRHGPRWNDVGKPPRSRRQRRLHPVSERSPGGECDHRPVQGRPERVYTFGRVGGRATGNSAADRRDGFGALERDIQFAISWQSGGRLSTTSGTSSTEFENTL